MSHNLFRIRAATSFLRAGFLAALCFCFLNPLAWAQYPFPDHTPLIDGDDGSAHNSCPPGNNLYKCQYHGFLYGHWNDGSNTEDSRHAAVGTARAIVVKNQPKIVVLLIGMSHFTKEGCTNQPPDHQTDPNHPDLLCTTDVSGGTAAWSFVYKATHSQDVNNSKLVFVDCAQIGAVAGYWASNDTLIPPNQTQGLYANCNSILSAWPTASGGPLSPNQVQVVLFKEADSGEAGAPNPPLPGNDLPTTPFTGCPGTTYDVCNLKGFMTQIAQQVKSHYPNVQQMFVHGRSYAGYANPTESPLNPEPFAYEQGFAVKWLIQAQIDEVNSGIQTPPVLGYSIAPWLDWGTYIWASAQSVACVNCPGYFPPLLPVPTPLTWRDDIPTHNPPPFSKCPANFDPSKECDFQATPLDQNGNQVPDNTHPSYCGRDKVSNLMMYFYCNSPYTYPWFTASGTQGCPHLAAINNKCIYKQGTDLP